jgi:hypothetical protein
MAENQRRTTRIVALFLRYDPLACLTVIFLYGLLLSFIYDSEYAEERIASLLCRAGEHRWADEQDYGVQPVCLRCGLPRRYADG